MGREMAIHQLLNPNESMDTVPMPEWAAVKQSAAKISHHFMALRKIHEDFKNSAKQEHMRRKLVQEKRKNAIKQGPVCTSMVVQKNAQNAGSAP